VLLTGHLVRSGGLMLQVKRQFGRLGKLDLRAFNSLVYHSSFFRFGAVGTVGFLTDAVFLYSFVFLLGLNYFAGRILSFSVAVGVTLLLNRAWTFSSVRDRPFSRSILYVVSQLLGGLMNIAVYAGSAFAIPFFKSWLIFPLALGSGFGLLVTYSMSRYVAFRPTVRQSAPEKTEALGK
jgi:putative flippase GtrA